jgi:hypothetical protein
LLGPDHTQQQQAGQNVLYPHILTNTGTVTDIFDLTVHSSQGWPVALLGTGYPAGTSLLPLQVAAGMTAAFQVSLTIPENVAGVTDVTVVTATSQVSPTVRDTAIDSTLVPAYVFMPLVVQRWPPIPYAPTLQPIDNSDADAFFTVDWSAATLAHSYGLEQDDNPAFASPQQVFSGTATTWTGPDPGLAAGTYYYRVRGRNQWGYGPYSNVASVVVLVPDTPVLAAIDNEDGNGNYTVMWNPAARATSYTLEEDTTSNFGSPVTRFTAPETAWSATGKAPGTYFYRVRAAGASGQSGWSNIESVTVRPLRVDQTSVAAGECTTLRWDFDNIRAVYVRFGYGYDREGVTGHGTRQVCPSVDTTYEALVINQDGGFQVYRTSIDVSGTGCGDPVIERFSATTYEVNPGQRFSIFWDVECAETVRLIIGNSPEEPVEGHGSRIDVVIYSDTLFRLKVEKSEGTFVYASFTVKVR